jgi:hypothetical protein
MHVLYIFDLMQAHLATAAVAAAHMMMQPRYYCTTHRHRLVYIVIQEPKSHAAYKYILYQASHQHQAWGLIMIKKRNIIISPSVRYASYNSCYRFNSRNIL